VGAVRQQDLDGDLAAVLQVFGQIHRGHAAAPDLFLDAVTIRDGGSQLFRNSGHLGSLWVPSLEGNPAITESQADLVVRLSRPPSAGVFTSPLIGSAG
jgi:hypothetical protein